MRAPRSWRSKFSTAGLIERSKMLSASMTATRSRSTKRSARPERVGDPALPLLVGVGEPVDAVLVAVAEQAEELAGVRAAGDEHQLADPGGDERLDRVRDHRPVVDRQQVLVRDPGERRRRLPLPPARMTPFRRAIVLALAPRCWDGSARVRGAALGAGQG